MSEPLLTTQVFVKNPVPGEWPRPAATLIRPVTEEFCGWVKPRDGGLWTSSLTAEGRSGWIDWCLTEGFAGPEFDVWHLDPDPAARVYTVDKRADMAWLVERFAPVCDHDRRCDVQMMAGVSWRRVATEYDAVRLTDEGQWATRFVPRMSLYGWDCESTLWFRWRFIAVRHLGVQRFAVDVPDWNIGQEAVNG